MYTPWATILPVLVLLLLFYSNATQSICVKVFQNTLQVPKKLSEADFCVSSEATNAPKFVNSTFTSIHGGHRNRKRNISTEISVYLLSNIITPSKQLLCCKVDYAYHNIVSHTSLMYNINCAIDMRITLSTSPPVRNVRLSITRISILYRVILSNDLFALSLFHCHV